LLILPILPYDTSSSTTESSSTIVAIMVPMEKFVEYWKDDFTPLQAAASQINAALREDEQEADLYRRIGSGNRPSSHLYFPVGDSSSNNNRGINGTNAAAAANTPVAVPPLQQLQHRKTVPLPPVILEKLQGVKIQTLMGLLPPADLAWISVDEKLYLWSYDDATAGFRSPRAANARFCSFVVPSKQPILSVGLVRPKEGRDLSCILFVCSACLRFR